MQRSTCWLIGSISGCAAAIFSLIAVFAILPAIVNKTVKHEFSLQDGTEGMEKWIESAPVPVYFSIYVFNITNTEEIRTNKGKPKVQEIGPFVYRRYLEKRNRKPLDGGKMEYMQYSKFVFQPDKSGDLTEDMEIWTLNAPLVGAAMMHPIILKLLKQHPEWWSNENVFGKYKVGELLFQGFPSQILHNLGEYSKANPDLVDSIGIDIPPYLYEGVFSYFYGKNITLDGPYVVYDGIEENDKFTEFVSYKGRSHLELWKDPYCNMINGTDGFQYPPGVTKEDTIGLFTTDICRSVYSKFASEQEIMDITVYRFELAEKSFEMSEDNECFCKDREGLTESCYGNAWSMGPCQYNAPAVMTPPHFYKNPELQNAIAVGMHPDKDKHLMFQDVEPLTGATLQAHIRFQINFKINPIDIADMAELRDVVLPILWLDENASLDKENADKFKSMAVKPQQIGKGIFWTIFAIGLIMFAAMGFMWFRSKKSSTSVSFGH